MYVVIIIIPILEISQVRTVVPRSHCYGEVEARWSPRCQIPEPHSEAAHGSVFVSGRAACSSAPDSVGSPSPREEPPTHVPPGQESGLAKPKPLLSLSYVLSLS